MHRTKSKNITSQLKGVVKYLRRACTRLYSAETTPPADEDSDIISEVSRETTEYSPVSNSLYSLEPCVLCASEVYHSIRGSDAFSKHKYASVADLCSNLGSRLPLQLVKLVARDTLRALKSFHQRSNRAYRDISKQTIQLSHTDLTSIVVQLRAVSQSSPMSSQFSVHFPFPEEPEDQIEENGEVESLFSSPPADTNAPVFSLSSDIYGSIPGRTSVPHSLDPPEILLGGPCSKRTDMWTLGCLLFELMTGEPLFDPIFQTAELEISEEESHIIQMIELLGEMPKDLISRGNLSGKWFTEDGLLRIETTYFPTSLASILDGHIEKRDLKGTTEFLENFIRLRPEDRTNPGDMIDHQWFSS